MRLVLGGLGESGQPPSHRLGCIFLHLGGWSGGSLLPQGPAAELEVQNIGLVCGVGPWSGLLGQVTGTARTAEPKELWVAFCGRWNLHLMSSWKPVFIGHEEQKAWFCAPGNPRFLAEQFLAGLMVGRWGQRPPRSQVPGRSYPVFAAPQDQCKFTFFLKKFEDHLIKTLIV